MIEGAQTEKCPDVVVGIPLEIAAGDRQRIEQAIEETSEALGLRERIEAVPFKDTGDDIENAKQVEGIVKERGAILGLALRRGLAVDDLVGAVKEGEALKILNQELFRITNPELANLNETNVHAMSEEVLRATAGRLPSILSPASSQRILTKLEIANTRMRNIAHRTSSTSVPATKAVSYIAASGEKYMVSVRVNSLAEAKLQAEKHRDTMRRAGRINPKFIPVRLQIRLAVNAEDKARIEARPKADLLRLMGINDVLAENDLHIITPQAADALTIEQIYQTYIPQSDYDAKHVIIVEPGRADEAAYGDVVDRLFMEYGAIATSQVYDAALIIMTRDPKDPLITGLEEYKKGWFRFLPPITPNELNNIRNEFTRYKEVLFNA